MKRWRREGREAQRGQSAMSEGDRNAPPADRNAPPADRNAPPARCGAGLSRVAKLSVASVVSLVLLAGGLTLMGGRVSSVALLFGVAWLPYALLLVSRFTDVDPLQESGESSEPLNALGLGERRERAHLRRALGLATGVGLFLVCCPPVFSDDLYRYVWDGRVLLAGVDPYAHAPDSAALASLRDPLFEHINHRELPTIYPPVALLAFASVAWMGVAGPKLLALAAHLLLVLWVPRLVRQVGRPGASRVAYGVALNPLLLSEGALNGHVDLLAAALVVGALVAWVETVPGTNVDTHAGGALRLGKVVGLAALAIGVKLVGFLLVPLLLCRRERRAWGGALALVVLGLLLVWPVSRAGYGDRHVGSSLGEYARRWRGNDGLFSFVEEGIRGQLVERFEVRWGKLVLEPEPALLRWARGTRLDPREGLVPPKKEMPSDVLVEPLVLASPLARAAVLLALLGLGLWVVVRAPPPVQSARTLVLAALLLAPQVHPWYLALLVPLDLATGGFAGLAFAAAMLVAYAPLEVWGARREWVVATQWVLVAHAWVLAAWVAERGFRQAAPPKTRER